MSHSKCESRLNIQPSLTFYKQMEDGLLNESLSLAAALGVNKYSEMYDLILVELYCDVQQTHQKFKLSCSLGFTKVLAIIAINLLTPSCAS
jgi:hypothetical protein